ncbi:MAG: CDP-alcohol phosphatidyltransferase family protein [Alphaproteobacteria bacterium]|nr:CDP-alcohol phosphatidyltransferase family protein [Alphaproteobacteria bacterium]
MLDRHIIPIQKNMLAPLARSIKASGISADQISLIGFAIGLVSVACLAFGHFLIALVLILANRLFDGLDGAVARINGPTDRGAFLDITFDFVFYALIPLGFAITDPNANALAAACLIASFVGTGSSFLAFAIIAEKRDMNVQPDTAKGIFYLGGLTEGTETIILFSLICIWPNWFALLAYGFSVLCVITTLSRWYQGWTSFEKDKIAKIRP